MAEEDGSHGPCGCRCDGRVGWYWIIVAVIVTASLRSLYRVLHEFIYKVTHAHNIDACGDSPTVFISHHKRDAGGAARLMKLMLTEKGMTDIFLDSGGSALMVIALVVTCWCPMCINIRQPHRASINYRACK